MNRTRIAITGGIGSGKSTVSKYLADFGYVVIDADKLSRDITASGGKAIPYIIENFGEDYILPDGSMDRNAIRELVYSDPGKMEILERGTTDVVIQDIEVLVDDAFEDGESVVFVDIPLLFETNTQDMYDAIWMVSADEDTRIARIVERDGFDANTARSIISKQMSDAVKRSLATDIIDNSGTIQQLYNQVNSLLSIYDRA